MARSCGSVVVSSCGYIVATKPEAVLTLMHTYICIDGGIQLIFKIHILNRFLFPIFIGKPILRTY